MAAPLSSSPPASNRRISVDQLVELLAPALGREKSHELILACAKSLGHPVDRLTLKQALTLLESLGSDAGIVGISARFAQARLLAPQKKRADSAAPQSSLASASESASSRPAATIESDALAALLAHSIGTEKSREVVQLALAQLGISTRNLSAEQAHAVLECCAKMDGIVGVTARFAKARLILRLKK
ncbi:MAG TPA: hypothetical protein VGM44_02715 [Polyangiaceae bacterium]